MEAQRSSVGFRHNPGQVRGWLCDTGAGVITCQRQEALLGHWMGEGRGEGSNIQDELWKEIKTKQNHGYEASEDRGANSQ